jgi:hypothetical protein
VQPHGLVSTSWSPESQPVNTPGTEQNPQHSVCHLLARWFAEPISSTLKMEAISSSETSVEFQRTTRRHIPEDATLQNHGCENLKSYNIYFFLILRTP